MAARNPSAGACESQPSPCALPLTPCPLLCMHSCLHRVHETAENRRDISRLQADLDERESLLLLECGVERIPELPRRVRAESAAAPEFGELRKRPSDGLVVARLGEERLQHLPSAVVEHDDNRIAAVLARV